MEKWWPRVFCCALALSASLGCVSEGKRVGGSLIPAVGRGTIEEINLLAIPVALNMDEAPGLDGFIIKIYPASSKHPKTVPIDSGSIEVLMFDGIPSNAHAKPRFTWSYTAQDLKRYEIQTSIGTGYQLAPLWGDAKPSSHQIAVVVRYTTPRGAVISSAPSIISVALK